MERALPVAIVPVIALILLAPAHGDSWTGPEALLDVGVQSWLVIKDVHEKTVATGHGGTEKVLDYVIAEYRAYIRAKEPGEPVTLHVLLPEGTEVLEARFCPTTTVLSDRFGVRWERAEPVGRIKGHLGVPRREMEVDPTRLPGRPEARSQGSDLLLGAGPEAQDPRGAPGAKLPNVLPEALQGSAKEPVRLLGHRVAGPGAAGARHRLLPAQRPRGYRGVG